MNTRDPSLHRCQRTFGAMPRVRAISISAASSPRSRSSGVNRMEPDCPTASSAVQPKIASAPGSQSVIRFCGSDTKIA